MISFTIVNKMNTGISIVVMSMLVTSITIVSRMTNTMIGMSRKRMMSTTKGIAKSMMIDITVNTEVIVRSIRMTTMIETTASIVISTLSKTLINMIVSRLLNLTINIPVNNTMEKTIMMIGAMIANSTMTLSNITRMAGIKLIANSRTRTMPGSLTRMTTVGWTIVGAVIISRDSSTQELL